MSEPAPEDRVPSPQAPFQVVADVTDLVALAAPLEQAANAMGIYNVFDDGGYRDLLILRMFDLRRSPGRSGNDALGPDGEAYELKTVNLIDTRGQPKRGWPGVTTEHSLTRENVRRYREVRSWLVGVFRGNQPIVVYEVSASSLEAYFSKWEAEIRRRRRDLNNPKIPMGFIIDHGRVHYPLGAAASANLPPKPRYRPVKDNSPNAPESEGHSSG
jgi:hypothetical protein